MAFLDLTIERAVAGGRMLARHDGVVVLVAGAIPGEHVRARIERRTRSLIWADVVEVVEPSPARRQPVCDRACGGMDYGHINYPDQLRLKAAVLADAFKRIGKVDLDASVDVVPSPERGYRLRGRLHVRGGRAGFFREGTHELCDAARTEQFCADTLTAVDGALAALGTAIRDLDAVTISENIAGNERVLHLEPRVAPRRSSPSSRGASSSARFQQSSPTAGLTGMTTTDGRLMYTVSGSPYLTDTAADLFVDDAPVPVATSWTRHATSFFQGNRFLAGALVRAVLALVQGHRMLDLYTGAGLFSVAGAARGLHVLAVEGDLSSAEDLARNLAPWASTAEAVQGSIEMAAARLTPGQYDTVVVDPPRSGLTPEALTAVLHLRAPTLVYVSCDPATLARDTAAIRDGGYAIRSVQSFDLFPNTAHIETVIAFDRSS